MLNHLNQIIEEAKKALIGCPKMDVVHNKVINSVEDFFYRNIIKNYETNLNEENIKEFNISEKCVENIKKEVKKILNSKHKGNINFKLYQIFREKINNMGKEAYNLLLELEKQIGIISCEKQINRFKKEVNKLGYDLNIHLK